MKVHRAGDKRQRAERTGRWAELVALIFLLLKGYRPLGRRIKTPKGELDLIAKRGKTVVFAEVKWRTNAHGAISAVTPHQAKRLVSAARYWIARDPAYAHLTYRFDIIAMSPYLWPVHIENAFSEDLF